MRVLAVCIGLAQMRQDRGQSYLTAIGKTAVEGPVAVGRLGLASDEQADLSVQGEISNAVYAYPSEHLPFWQTVRAQAGVAAWGEAIAPGLLGENLLLEGLRETGLWIGDRLWIGRGDDTAPPCVLAVIEPRMPWARVAAISSYSQP